MKSRATVTVAEKSDPRTGGEASRKRASELLETGTQTGAGVHDALSAILAAKAGYQFLWVSSFALSATAGMPDVGLITPDDLRSTVRVLGRASDLPLVVDLEAGHGTPLQTYSVVTSLAQLGVRAVCIEDNPLEKRCSLYDDYDRSLVSIPEHQARIRAAKAAIDAAGADCAVIARTEALVAGEGVERALERAGAYVDTGADGVFVQATAPAPDDLFRFLEQWERRTAVFLAPTRYPRVAKTDFFAAGASHVIYANHALRAAHAAMARTLNALATARSAEEFEPELSSVAEVSDDVGEPTIRALSATLEVL